MFGIVKNNNKKIIQQLKESRQALEVIRNLSVQLDDEQLKILELLHKYRQIFEYASDPMVLIDAHTLGIMEFNKKVLDIFGYTEEEFLKLNLWDILGLDREDVKERIRPILEQGAGSLRIVHEKDGKKTGIYINVVLITISGKDILQSIWKNSKADLPLKTLV